MEVSRADTEIDGWTRSSRIAKLGILSLRANPEVAPTTASPKPQVYKHELTTDNVVAGTMLVSLTVGKVDAGVAVLLTQDKRLVSLYNPSIALTSPSHCTDPYHFLPS
jgi:hypothetical protein